MKRELIEQYADGAEKLSLAIRGLTPQDMVCAPDPQWNAGKWSIQQVVIHVADCEQVYADRMKWVISEDNPPLPGFDQEKWAAALLYEEQSAQEAAKLVELTRKQMASVLRKLPDDALARVGQHSERGAVKVIDLVQYMATHLDHHVNFIHQKRAKMGKEMW
jgi:uncharacterized damage-inducible protein DinB